MDNRDGRNVFKVPERMGKNIFTIIPDLNILQEKKITGEKKDPFKYSIET